MDNDARHFLELLWAITEKELRARYKYTIFGFLWLVVNPLLQMLVIGFVFTFFIKEPIIHYYYYLFLGLITWNFFSVSVSKATPCIVNERSLIKKAKFPYIIIPLSIILSNFIHYVSAILLYLIPVFFLNTLTVASIFYAALAFLLLLTFTVGFSFLASALNVRFRDVAFFVQALLTIWFYATPVVYSFNLIPYRFIWLWRLNPMTSILQLLQHAFINFPLPGPAMLTANITVITIVTVIGVLIFRRESRNFDDWV